ncbi:MAG: hypothetical protein COZ01_03865 [Zetaproteobacteria bacterium CG_4_10_14_0_8_um_filter_55_43]|nr:MAG: hypothetical protein COZ01_03865 [Zetaproteobacteria bacterium CG_4_10_14_0_8_um_filter_55_43]
MSKIAKAAGYELSLRDMGMSGNLDEAPVPSWISDLGADSAAYAPFEVFQRRLKSKTYIELDASLKRLETYAGGVK